MTPELVITLVVPLATALFVTEWLFAPRSRTR